MIQPSVISGIVAKANSSAPRRQAITTSLGVLIDPSTCKVTLCLKSFLTSVLCVSVNPISQGVPQYLIEFQLAAPVPPSCPDTTI